MHTVFDEVLQTIEQILYSPFYHSLDIQLQSDLTDERRASVTPASREGVSEAWHEKQAKPNLSTEKKAKKNK